MNDLFVDINTLAEEKSAEKALFKCQHSYTKAVETHLCITDHHNLIKKFIFTVKVDLLLLEELCEVAHLLEDILNLYYLIVSFTLHFVDVMLTFSKMT